VKPRERFSSPAPGVACPLCLSKSFTIVTARDLKRGLTQSIYRCGECKSYFGDPGEAAARPRKQ
jgi:DNA-directed RNA polymerase subunit RPC12/RpoP